MDLTSLITFANEYPAIGALAVLAVVAVIGVVYAYLDAEDEPVVAQWKHDHGRCGRRCPNAAHRR